MGKIVVTGAAGTIGRLVVSDLRSTGAEVLGLDLVGDPTNNIISADLSVWDAKWYELLRGSKAIVHLAADAWPDAGWDRIVPRNLDMMLNIFQAAVWAGVERVVFASSNWVLAGHRFDTAQLDESTPPIPVNAYGSSKLFGERTALSFSRSHGLSVICLRIGAVQPEPGASPQPDSAMGDWAGKMWLSQRDLCQGIRKSVEAPSSLRFAILNLVSQNEGMRWDLKSADELIGYKPEDSFSAPEGGYTRTEDLAAKVHEAIGAMDRFFHKAEL